VSRCCGFGIPTPADQAVGMCVLSRPVRSWAASPQHCKLFLSYDRVVRCFTPPDPFKFPSRFPGHGELRWRLNARQQQRPTKQTELSASGGGWQPIHRNRCTEQWLHQLAPNWREQPSTLGRPWGWGSGCGKRLLLAGLYSKVFQPRTGRLFQLAAVVLVLMTRPN
jgi:hypothetical protein